MIFVVQPSPLIPSIHNWLWAILVVFINWALFIYLIQFEGDYMKILSQHLSSLVLHLSCASTSSFILFPKWRVCLRKNCLPWSLIVLHFSSTLLLLHLDHLHCSLSKIRSMSLKELFLRVSQCLSSLVFCISFISIISFIVSWDEKYASAKVIIISLVAPLLDFMSVASY